MGLLPDGTPPRTLAAASRRREAASAAVVLLLSSGCITNAVHDVRALTIPAFLTTSAKDVVVNAGVGFMKQNVAESITSSLAHGADVASIEEHLRLGCAAAHPDEGWGLADGSPRDLRAAVAQLCEWQKDTPSRRAATWSRLLSILKRPELEAMRAKIRREHTPQHILTAHGPEVDVVSIAVLSQACDFSLELAVSSTIGAPSVGHIHPFGDWPPSPPPSVPPTSASPPPVVDPVQLFDSMDHASDMRALSEAIGERALAAEATGGEAWADLQSVWGASLKELDKGLIDGPWSSSDLDAMFGSGAWRAMERFGVWQRGKCRACDNAAKSRHNECTGVSQKPSFDTADFPARVAALFAAAGLFPELRGGTDDIEAAYRRISTAWPQYTVVSQWDPVARRVVFFTLPGFNFGLVSAVHCFNRYPVMVTRAMRRLFGWAGTGYFDDFCTVEPVFARASGQTYLDKLMALLGIPLAAEKHVPMAPSFQFLGVVADLSRFARRGVVQLGVSRERAVRIADSLRFFLDANSLFPSEASKLGGRLGFASTWASFNFGRALMQPLYRRQAELAASALNAGLRASMGFLWSVLSSTRGIPPRLFSFADDALPTAYVWTDAAWEPGTLGRVAYVVFVPDASAPRSPLAERLGLPPGSWTYADADTPADVMARFCPNKGTYIGQLELLAAIMVYWSLAWLRGRRSFHWIDNQGAIACLIKGYASAPDCLPLLHAWVVFALESLLKPWFMYVPSKANISDLPSRQSYRMLRDLWAVEGPLSFPPFHVWDRPPREWLDAGVPAPLAPRVALGTVALGNSRISASREYDVRIDRASGSPLGNPFLLAGETTRELVCDLCDEVMASADPSLVTALARAHAIHVAPGFGPDAHAARVSTITALAERVALGCDIRLMCHCYPRRCHGFGVAALIRRQAASIVASRQSRKRVR